jgi:hypothetical protein
MAEMIDVLAIHNGNHGNKMRLIKPVNEMIFGNDFLKSNLPCFYVRKGEFMAPDPRGKK